MTNVGLSQGTGLSCPRVLGISQLHSHSVPQSFPSHMQPRDTGIIPTHPSVQGLTQSHGPSHPTCTPGILGLSQHIPLYRVSLSPTVLPIPYAVPGYWDYPDTSHCTGSHSVPRSFPSHMHSRDTGIIPTHPTVQGLTQSHSPRILGLSRCTGSHSVPQSFPSDMQSWDAGIIPTHPTVQGLTQSHSPRILGLSRCTGSHSVPQSFPSDMQSWDAGIIPTHPTVQGLTQSHGTRILGLSPVQGQSHSPSQLTCSPGMLGLSRHIPLYRVSLSPTVLPIPHAVPGYWDYPHTSHCTGSHSVPQSFPSHMQSRDTGIIPTHPTVQGLTQSHGPSHPTCTPGILGLSPHIPLYRVSLSPTVLPIPHAVPGYWDYPDTSLCTGSHSVPQSFPSHMQSRDTGIIPTHPTVQGLTQSHSPRILELSQTYMYLCTTCTSKIHVCSTLAERAKKGRHVRLSQFIVIM